MGISLLGAWDVFDSKNTCSNKYSIQITIYFDSAILTVLTHLVGNAIGI